MKHFNHHITIDEGDEFEMAQNNYEILTKAELEQAAGRSSGITELVFILDRSGSMEPLTDDTIGGFNSLLEKQKSEDGACVITTVFFNHDKETVHDRIALEKAGPISRKDYVATGSTALLDAVGATLKKIATLRKYLRTEDIPEKTLVIITTDGMENSSRHYTKRQIKQLIENLQKISGWEFMFLGANIDAIDAAESIGISAARASDYCADSAGTGVVYSTVSRAINGFRKTSCLDSEWKEDLENDIKRRKNKNR